MFGMGGSEIIVILIVALLFLGPDKLPDAAKKISKGIRDINDRLRAVAEAAGAYSVEGRERELSAMSREEIGKLVDQMAAEMKAAAKELDFERRRRTPRQLIEHHRHSDARRSRGSGHGKEQGRREKGKGRSPSLLPSIRLDQSEVAVFAPVDDADRL